MFPTFFSHRILSNLQMNDFYREKLKNSFFFHYFLQFFLLIYRSVGGGMWLLV